MNSARLSPEELISELAGLPEFRGQVFRRFVSPRESAAFAKPATQLHAGLRSRLDELGIEKFFSHQAASIDLAAKGSHLVVVTGTGSGKTLCYNVPVINRLMQEPAARALYLFPTKALAQDQLGKLSQLAPPGLRMATYDGDTPKNQRAAIRKTANIILTNPDMLHIGILPNISMWAQCLKSLRFIVIDEMHAYSGIFGSHVSLVLRRLLRLCRWLGSNPQIIACSATINNPVELYKLLTGEVPELIDTDGAAKGRKHHLFWEPREQEDGTRRSPIYETALLLSELTQLGARTMAFSKSRIHAELVLNYARSLLEPVGLGDAIESYRAGYTPDVRRAIEKRLFSGDLMGISTTSAMELGVDVGGLDAVILNGYPGSVSSFRQQAGRAGRGADEGLAIFVAHENPLDEYLLGHPDTIVSGAPEMVRIQPDNKYVLRDELQCAIYERPLAPSELEIFPPSSIDTIEELERDGRIERRGGLWYHASYESPASGVNIRGAGGQFSILKDGNIIGTMEEWRARQNAFPGAVYIHQGEQFLVSELSIEERIITVKREAVNYFTEPLCETSVWPTALIAKRNVGKTEIELMGLNITTTVVAYRMRKFGSEGGSEQFPLEMPSQSFDGIGVRLNLEIDQEKLDEIYAVHAIEHLLTSLAPLATPCESRDLGSAYYPFWPDTEKAAVYVFDMVPGGVGIAEALYASADRWVKFAKTRVDECECADGCPACILNPWCPFSNEQLSKKGARELLGRTLA